MALFFVFLTFFWTQDYSALATPRAILLRQHQPFNATLPLITSTWANEKFMAACEAGWQKLVASGSRLDAIEAGGTACEELQCDYTVGYGGSPDESGETTLDALIMDGPKHQMGAVAALRRIKNAIGVARSVMTFTKHSMLAGDQAADFAKMMGFEETSLTTPESTEMWRQWESQKCQPNFRQSVTPNPTSSCGPYQPIHEEISGPSRTNDDPSWTEGGRYHDTIGMVVIDESKDVSVGTSTNGASHKIPGRVGDGPIPGAGAYLDNDVGGASETGDGDVMMRFLPSYQAVEFMRQGLNPMDATARALRRVRRFYPNFSGAVIAANKAGQVGAACNGMDSFSFSLRTRLPDEVQVLKVKCLPN